MMLAFDTSAWLARYLDSDARPVTVEAMKRHPNWCASSLVLAESLIAMDRLGLARAEAETLEDQMRSDWDRVHQIPVDHRCLTAATLIARQHPARMIDALHLAAADRLPRPVNFLTHEPTQIPVALALGYKVISTSDQPTHLGDMMSL